MRKALLISLFMAATIVTGWAQPGALISDLLDPTRINTMWDKFGLEDINGSPYLFDYWADGHIENTTGGVFKDLVLKYDAFNDQVVFKNNKGDSIVINKEMVKRFTIAEAESGNVTTFETFTVGGELRYMQNLYDGDLKLLHRRTKRIKKAPPSNGYNAGQAKDSFVDDAAYFVVGKDGKPKEVKLNRAGLMKAFPKYKNRIKDFLKSQGLKGNNPAETILVLKYLEDKM